MPSHLLLVDDEAHNRKLLRMVLRQGDYTFSEAEDGRQALAILDQERVDLVLLDLMMPSPNGFDVIHAMRSNDRLRDIPVIVASASTAPDDVERSLSLGAADYFMKPLTEWDIRFQLPIKVRNAIGLTKASEERLKAERMKAVSAMAVALNHEINNPLQVIQGNAQLLYVNPGISPEAREKVQRIRQATETIAGLTHRIAALRDIVTVDYPAGNRTAVPMVNFKASTETSADRTDGTGTAPTTPTGAKERSAGGSGGSGGSGSADDQTPNIG